MLKRKNAKDSQTLLDKNIRKSEFQWSFIKLNNSYNDEIIQLFENYYDILSNKERKDLKKESKSNKSK